MYLRLMQAVNNVFMQAVNAFMQAVNVFMQAFMQAVNAFMQAVNAFKGKCCIVTATSPLAKNAEHHGIHQRRINRASTSARQYNMVYTALSRTILFLISLPKSPLTFLTCTCYLVCVISILAFSRHNVSKIHELSKSPKECHRCLWLQAERTM